MVGKWMKYLASLLVLAFLLAGCTGADGIHYPHLITPPPPLPASTPSLVPTVTNTPQCLILGNINAQGIHTAFKPGDAPYSEVKIDKPGEKCFATMEEAQAAGFTPYRGK